MSWNVFTKELDEITRQQLSELGLGLATLARQRAAAFHGIVPKNQRVRARGKDGRFIAEADVRNTAPDEVRGHHERLFPHRLTIQGVNDTPFTIASNVLSQPHEREQSPPRAMGGTHSAPSLRLAPHRSWISTALRPSQQSRMPVPRPPA